MGKKVILPEVIPLLGLETDATIANAFGLNVSTIRRWRIERGIYSGRRGILPFEGCQDRETWLDLHYPGMRERLGVETDAALGREYGICRERIRQFREQLAVDSVRAKEWEALEKSVLTLLAVHRNSEIAKMLNVHSSSIQKLRLKHKITEPGKCYAYMDKLLQIKDRMGKDSDNFLAKETGIRQRFISKWRIHWGIPRARISPACPEFQKISREEIARLYHEGKSDKEIAAIVGSTKESVGMIRTRELKLLRRPMHKVRAKIIDRSLVEQMFKNGNTDEEIAEALHAKPKSITAIRRRELRLLRPSHKGKV